MYEHESAHAVVMKCLGCSEAVASLVILVIGERLLWTPSGDSIAFEQLAWSAFADYRRNLIAVGGSDPMWDLRSPAPVEEGGAP